MRDLIIEDILQGALKEQLRHPARKDSVVPTSSRYPHTAKRAELEREWRPWSQRPKAQADPSASQRFYL